MNAHAVANRPQASAPVTVLIPVKSGQQQDPAGTVKQERKSSALSDTLTNGDPPRLMLWGSEE